MPLPFTLLVLIADKSARLSDPMLLMTIKNNGAR
jgi:hypothetical protein